MKTNTLLILITILSSLTLNTCEEDPPAPPDFSSKITITTYTVSSITYRSATVSGVLSDTYGQQVSDYGHCWDSLTSPTVDDSKTAFGTINTAKSFNSSLEDLEFDRKYYIRAYFVIDNITVYGNELSFNTLDGKPTVTTATSTNITTSSATSGGNITDKGGTAITARGVCWNTSGSPTITDSKTNDDSGTGSFTSSITGLTENTTYYVRAYATNSYGTGYGQEVQFTTGGPVTDYDGNTYETVTLGNQVWMAENLKVTHYPDGSAIPHVTDNSVWANLVDNNTDDAYCYYNNNSSSEYGALYTYAAALNACPAGWHLPSDTEWTEMENYLADNGYNYDGTIGGGRDKIAKAMATASGWNSSSTAGAVGNTDYPVKRNSSGFSGLPGGRRLYNAGTFYPAGRRGYWWSSTEYSSTLAYYRTLYYDDANVYRNYFNKSLGFSVRCVRDD
jgi:uncharacterized protein (TIGR02145 family)